MAALWLVVVILSRVLFGLYRNMMLVNCIEQSSERFMGEGCVGRGDVRIAC